VSSQPGNTERERLLSTIEHVSVGGGGRRAGRGAELVLEEVGEVTYVGHGIARVTGLPSVQSEELVRFPRGLMGMAFTLSEDEVGVILLGDGQGLWAGAEVRRTGRVIDVAVGDELLGRVVNALANRWTARPDPDTAAQPDRAGSATHHGPRTGADPAADGPQRQWMLSSRSAAVSASLSSATGRRARPP